MEYTGDYEHLGPDTLTLRQEQVIGAEGMKIDRMLFDRFADTVRADETIAAAVRAGQWDRVIDYVQREVFDKPEEYYTLAKLRSAAAVDRRVSLREILEKVFDLIPRFKSKDELLEEEFAKFMADHTPARATSVPALKHYFKAYVGNGRVRDIIDRRQFAQLATDPVFTTRDYRAVHVAFFKVEHDGYDLGAQRRPIERNDLPQAKAEVGEYLRRLRVGEAVADFAPTLGQVVAKERVAADGDYNLSGERYRENKLTISQFEMMSLGEVCEIRKGNPITRKEVVEGSIPVIAGGQKPSAFHNRANRTGETITVSASGAYAGFVSYFKEPIFASDCSTIKPKDGRLMGAFLFHVLKSKQAEIYKLQVGMGQPHVYPKDLSSFRIPLPQMETQREVMAEIENYQRVIDGARAVVENYRPEIPANPDWPLVELSRKGLFSIVSGGTPESGTKKYWDGDIPWITLVDLSPDDYITEITTTERTISQEGLQNSSAKIVPANSVIVSSRATIGRIGINRIALATNQGFKNVVIEDRSKAIPEYVALALAKLVPTMEAQASGATYKEISKSRFGELGIPLPPHATQQAIVAEIEAEQALIDSNLELIRRFEKKIQAAIARVWGDERISE